MKELGIFYGIVELTLIESGTTVCVGRDKINLDILTSKIVNDRYDGCTGSAITASKTWYDMKNLNVTLPAAEGCVYRYLP